MDGLFAKRVRFWWEETYLNKKIIVLLKKGQQQFEIAEYLRNNVRFSINLQSAVEKLIMG